MNKQLYITGICKISDNNISLNGKSVFSNPKQIPVNEFLKNGYRDFKTQYPKFFKMDSICKLGFLTVEILLGGNPSIKAYPSELVGVVLSNSSSSLNTDIDFYETIKDTENYFPSPAVFVYTLPNIIIGEICIRHKFKGENVFFVSEQFDPNILFNTIQNIFAFTNIQCVITGWVELLNTHYDSFLCTIERINNDEETVNNDIFDIENLSNIYLK